jgi:hypothetical protein
VAVKLTIEQQALKALMARLKLEDDGKALRTELNKNLKAAVQPAVVQAQSSIQAMPVKGADMGMRRAIAAALKPAVRASGTYTGVGVTAAKGKYPRGFNSAPAAFNHRGWSHALFGAKTSRNGKNGIFQIGKPGWFDTAMAESVPDAREAILAAAEAMAERICGSG